MKMKKQSLAMLTPAIFFSNVFYQHWDGSADTELMDRDWLCLWSLNVQLKNKCTQIPIQTYCFF